MSVKRVVSFPPFRLDFDTGQLWRETKQVQPLRPKNVAVLRYLVERAGQVVPAEELVREIWESYPGAREALKQGIFQLRHALGDNATAPQFIETVGQRGYRFLALIRWEQKEEDGTRASLVGREQELQKLLELFGQAQHGKRQIVFIAGEPGIGKTTLVDAFLNEVAGAPTVWVGRGQCIEHYGQGEAYLPILDALGHLSDRSGIELLVKFLVRHAPTWLIQMPALLDRVDIATVQSKVHGATRERMLREFVEAAEAFTTQKEAQVLPLLVLVLEDLHWSDYSTCDLLSALARRSAPARLLVIGTYRSGGLATDHPLRPVLQELRSHGQCAELTLTGLQTTDVEQYLATRFPLSTLPARLAQFLHQRTGGNPLFLVNLVNDLVEQHLLVKGDTGWSFQGTLETIATQIPETSRQLIVRQIERIPPDIARTLEAASVAGAEFSAAAVAAALQTDLETIEEHCKHLVRREEFLRQAGISEWPDATLTTRYAFRHTLFQELWYEQIPMQRRQRFHLRIAERIEQAYRSHTGEVASELAVHFEQGRDSQRALQYLQQAAQTAMQRFAHQEAANHLTRGLQLLTALPDTPTRAKQELGLQVTLGPTLMVVKGYAAPEVEHAYARARELCQQMGDAPQLFPVLLGMCGYYLVRAELQKASQLGAQCLTMAQQVGDTDQLLGAHFILGLTAFYQGEFIGAQEHYEHIVALYNPQRHRPGALSGSEDSRVTSLSHAAVALWLRGYPDQAFQKGREVLTFAQNLDHPFTLAGALVWTGCWLHFLRREAQIVQTQAETVVTLARDQGFPVWAAVGMVFRGSALVAQDHDEEGIRQIEQGLAMLQATGAGLNYPNYLALLAAAYAKVGQAERGLTLLEEVFAIVDQTEERHFAAELFRLKGELTCRPFQVSSPKTKGQKPETRTLSEASRPQAEAEAEGYFSKAIEIARNQHAKSLELRAVMSLVRLRRQQLFAHTTRAMQNAARVKLDEAHTMLAEIYGWFTEGWDTRDLQEAKALLTVQIQKKSRSE